jgi:hypothetical protein
MKLFQIRTECGAEIQAGKLTEAEERYQLTICPAVCPTCHNQHGLEHASSITEVEVAKKP